MTTSNNNNDESLVQKIQVLLRCGEAQDECLLCALVLMTRLQDTEKLQQIWTKDYPAMLHTFCQRLLHSTPESSENNNNTRLLHIVACVVSRVHNSGDMDRELGQGLLNVLATRVDKRITPLTNFDVDLLSALHACLARNDDNELVRDALDTIWNRHQSIIAGNVTSESFGNENDDEWKLVDETLDTLLGSGENVLKAFEESMLQIWNTSASFVCETTLPDWYEPMFMWITSLSSDEDDNASERRSITSSLILTEWHAVLLKCTLVLALDHTTDRLAQLLLKRKQFVKSLLDLIQFYIASNRSCVDVTTNKVTLLAWTTLATLVTRFGFEWVNRVGESSTSSSSLLGNAAVMCVVTRLAAGEWRIQLGRHLTEEASDSEQSVLVVNSCGQVICSALQFAAEYANDENSDTTPATTIIPSTALLHLRDSLYDALHATVQYLCHDSLQIRFVAPSQVLASLLQEFDVWDSLPNGITTDETLHALSVAIKSAVRATQETDADNVWMPSLLAVFASAHDDSSESVTLLKKFDLLGDTIVQVLVLFWKKRQQEGMEAPHCILACQVAELWYALAQEPPKKSVSTLRKAVMQWIQSAIGGRLEYVSGIDIPSLAAAVDCYIMLCGQDTIPMEREAALIQRALEICASHSSNG